MHSLLVVGFRNMIRLFSIPIFLNLLFSQPFKVILTIGPLSFKPQKVCIALFTHLQTDFQEVLYPVGVPKNRTLDFRK